MATVKYYYDPETCRYEKLTVSWFDRVLNVMYFLFLSVLVGIGFGFLFLNVFENDKLSRLQKERKELEIHYKLIDKKMEETYDILASLQDRDDDIYRVIFEAEPIPADVREAGYGGVEHYKDLLDKGLENEKLIVGTHKKLDKLRKQMYIQTKSYDELVSLIKNKEALLASIPAILPINRNYFRFSSGYGMRTDPIYKTLKFHAGLDFAARRGTKIYATGQAQVVKVGRSKGFAGYGNIVLLDHGYGYQTLYAHLSDVSVKRGQRVNRGDEIGKVGNTGKSTGPHLHYEVIKNGKKINPVNFFFNDLTPEQYEVMLEQSTQVTQTLD